MFNCRILLNCFFFLFFCCRTKIEKSEEKWKYFQMAHFVWCLMFVSSLKIYITFRIVINIWKCNDERTIIYIQTYNNEEKKKKNQTKSAQKKITNKMMKQLCKHQVDYMASNAKKKYTCSKYLSSRFGWCGWCSWLLALKCRYMQSSFWHFNRIWWWLVGKQLYTLITKLDALHILLCTNGIIWHDLI